MPGLQIETTKAGTIDDNNIHTISGSTILQINSLIFIPTNLFANIMRTSNDNISITRQTRSGSIISL